MRRFLVDALLVLLLVTLATYISEPKTQEDLNHQISQFEDEVARHEPLTQKVESSRLNDIDENTAAKIAGSSSDFVITVMEKSVDVLAELVRGFMK